MSVQGEEAEGGDAGSRIRIPDPDPGFLPISDPGSRNQKGTGSWIRIRNTVSTVFVQGEEAEGGDA